MSSRRSKKPEATEAPLAGAHAERAEWYARGVVAGTIPAGRWVRAAAARHLADLERAGSPYVFDPAAGARPCRFIELFAHTKGQWAARKERIVLEPWQCFLIVALFGWLRKKNGKRRFRKVYWEIPRKNGKSLLAAAIGLYMLLADNEHGGEVYSGATSEKQAWEVFRPARLMLLRNPELAARFGVDVRAKSLVVVADESKFETIIGNPGDGASPSCAIVDEFHEHDTPAMVDTMETGMGAREQPLLLIITTAGANIAGPCHEQHDECCKVLNGAVENDELFCCMFGIDPGDSWSDPAVLVKANPNYGVSVDADFLQSQQQQAKQNPIQQAKFKTKHLNVWCSTLEGIINMELWLKLADRKLDESQLIGCDNWISLDLASKSDLCAEQRLYRRMIDGAPHYYLFGRYWLPAAAVEEPGPNFAHYRKWAEIGVLTVTEGATVDYDLVTETVIEDCKRSSPAEVVYDPFNATPLAQAVMREGAVAVEFIQTPQAFAVPLDELVTAIKDGRLHHDGNEITTWCMSNLVARPTRKGLVAPTKLKPHQKIDGAIACIMALARATAGAEPAAPVNIRYL